MPNDAALFQPSWPDGKRFAFTIVDDTDGASVAKLKPIYDFLAERGFRTTKTVWPLAPVEQPVAGGASLAEPAYRRWILELAAAGFEIASHGTCDHSSPRDRILAGFERFRAELGIDPRLHANHTGQRESIYWGAARFDGAPNAIYRLAQRLRRTDAEYFGHRKDSAFFWGDLCRARIDYVRNFVFRDLNTLKEDPYMPYADPHRSYVSSWFSSTNGAIGPIFCEAIAEAHQDRLVEEGGACIMYTHLAYGFLHRGHLEARFVRLMKRLAALPGWFVPASPLLDHLSRCRGAPAVLSEAQLQRIAWRWLATKLRHPVY